jgi:sugar (pentulose or hexulose) kinase
MILGIDLGSTIFKAALFDRDLITRGTGAATVPVTPCAGNRVELPVPATEAAFQEALAGALESAAVKHDAVEAIAITSQAQTFTIRAAAGAARIPFISWRDPRGEKGPLMAAAPTDFAQHCSVAECLPLLMAAKLAWLQDDSKGGLVGADDLVLMLPTWFVLQLTGNPVVDDNLAAMSGLYSLRRRTWWDEAVGLCGIRERNLPSLARLGTIAGTTVKSAKRYGLPPGIPVVLAGNDQTAGAYGAAIHEQDAALITLGTAQVVYVVRQRMPAPATGVMRGPYPGGLCYQLVADDHGAGTVHWARTVLASCASEADFDRAVERGAADCGGVRFSADGPAGSGRWIDVTTRTTEADKARAVLLCLVERMAKMLDRLQPLAPEQRLLLTGGGSNSPGWRNCLQQRLGKSLHRIEAAAPTLGAARMAREHGLKR